MSSINPTAQQVFDYLLKRLGGSDYVKLHADGYMPLSVECIGQLSCCYGTAKMYSLMHTFTQNGDLMRDPEICFFHFTDDDKDKLQGAIPYSYQLDALGIYQESIEIINGALIINSSLQKQHADFASIWLRNIKEQGFVK